MTQRATIERDMAAGTDDWGNPLEPVWSTHLTGVPCRTWFTTGREVSGPEKTAVVEDRRLIVPLGTDVTEADRVAQIADRQGTVLHSGPIAIEKVGRREDHLDLMLEGVS